MFFLKTEYEGELQISLLKYSTHLMLMEKKRIKKEVISYFNWRITNFWPFLSGMNCCLKEVNQKITLAADRQQFCEKRVKLFQPLEDTLTLIPDKASRQKNFR